MTKRRKKRVEPKGSKPPTEVHQAANSLVSSRKFSRRQAIIAASALALFGVVAVLVTHASASPVATVQAEQMVLPAGGSVISDSAASGLKAVKLDANATAHGSFVLPSDVTVSSLVLTAHGDSCHGWAGLSLSVDGKVAIPQTATSTISWKDYVANVNLASGSHTIDITATNTGSFKSNCFRSLYLDVVNLFGPTPPANPLPTVNLKADPITVAVGASSTLTWSSTNATGCSASGGWSGAKSVSGSESTAAISAATTYTLSCTGPGGSANSSVTVGVSGSTQPALPACTLYASPTGTATAAGTTSAPLSLAGSYTKATAGTVVCLMNGTYPLSSVWYFGKSGTLGHPIVYRSQTGKASDVTITYTGAQSASNVIQLVTGSSPPASAASYVEFYGLTIDGQNKAVMGFKFDGYNFHNTISYNIVKNVGSCGIGTIKSDYTTTVGNYIHHTGYDPATSWCSGISYNTNIAADTAPGFHSYMIGNIISGTTDESSYHTDGGGIIMDLGGNIPATLIANNVVYNNGSQCINLLHTANIWVVNNTCYKNRLDLRLSGGGEIDGNGTDSTNNYFVNNIAYAWSGRVPFAMFAGATATFSHNIEWGGNASGISSDTIRQDPLFTDAPAISNPPTANQQYTALEPWSLGSRLVPLTGSPAINGGIDPRTLSGATTALRVGMDKYLPYDIQGNARPLGGAWDVGAYEK